MTVDGTHCPIQETRPFSKKWSSHKLGKKAGLNYEIGIQISQSRVVWVNGPFPASLNDLTVFREKGLKEALPTGKRCMGDEGYTHEETISTRNDFDPTELAMFKWRALSRHETFNSRLKSFHCLKSKFCHGITKHKVAFEAVCLILIYEMENGSPLLDPYPWF